MLKLSYHITTRRKETISLMSKSITQDMAYRQSLMKYAEKYGVSRASRKYNKSRSYIYFWKQRWDGSVASLGCQSRRPHSHPNQHTEAELKLIRDMRRRNPTLGMSNCGIVCGSGAIPVARRACSASCVKWTCFRLKNRRRPTNQSLMSR